MDHTSQVQGVIHCMLIVTWIANSFDLLSFWDQGQSWNDWRQKGNEVFITWLFYVKDVIFVAEELIIIRMFCFIFKKPRWLCVMVYPSACAVNPTGFVCGLCKTPGDSPKHLPPSLCYWALVFLRHQWECIKSSEHCSIPKVLSRWPAGCLWPISFYFVSPNLLRCLYIIISSQKSCEDTLHIFSHF